MRIEVLGATRAWREDGSDIDLRGPRHREVLARLVAADGRMVATDTLVADLWPDPPAGAVGALRTFVAALRRALEPERPPRTPPRVLVTEGPGYALRLPRVAVDAHRFEDALAAARGSPGSPGSPGSSEAFASLGEALAAWRGPAYADLPDVGWVRGERVRLGELRLQGVELRAAVLLDRGHGADLVADLDAHVTEHPWREPAWGLLARALYCAGRQADALATLRRARAMLVDQLGLDPSRALRQLETDLLTQSPALEPRSSPWPITTARLTTARLGPRTTVDVARALALAGGDALVSSRRDRLAAALAAERTGDVALTARVIGAYDVPAIWNRADDPEQSRAVVAAAERTLAALGPAAPADLRARLYATVAVESRAGDAAGPARKAEALARALGDPALLAFALNGVFLQSFSRPGLAPRRDAVGVEIIALSTRHGLPAFAILGHLARLQSASARGDLDAGSHHALAAEELAAEHESPLVPVLTQWFRALVTAARSTVPGGPSAAQAAAAYRAADAALEHAGMPGLHRGLLPLALLGLRLMHDRPAPTDPRLDWGPYAPWAAPLVLLARDDRERDDREQARAALTTAPEPPRDHLQEALWCLTARAAMQLGEPAIAARAARALWPARTEHAGAASGMITLGPVERYRAEAEATARVCRCGSGGSARGRCQCLR
ncbi:BTAD domain-containing putative transcriptional regulator [Parafrankia sp. FMc2]|uniref:BTAD domain-containing putative transcriptional regulator n=1 Tax=Parafrankia sp. FMc2 TaxID=3233196 RepID=UPI0034D62578